MFSTVCFYVCLACVVLGALIGLACVWIPDFSKSDTVWKGLFTSGILFTASAIAAVVARFLN